MPQNPKFSSIFIFLYIPSARRGDRERVLCGRRCCFHVSGATLHALCGHLLMQKVVSSSVSYCTV